MAGFDPAPILAHFADVEDLVAAETLGVHIDTIRNWRTGRKRLKAAAADRIAVRIGAHPGELWPEWWAEA